MAPQRTVHITEGKWNLQTRPRLSVTGRASDNVTCDVP
jgi:hypothetical protein